MTAGVVGGGAAAGAAGGKAAVAGSGRDVSLAAPEVGTTLGVAALGVAEPGDDAALDLASVAGVTAGVGCGCGLLAGAAVAGVGAWAVAGEEATAGAGADSPGGESRPVVVLDFATVSERGSADGSAPVLQNNESAPVTMRRITMAPSSTSVRVPIVRPRLVITGAAGAAGDSPRPPARACSAFFRASLMRLMAGRGSRGEVG